MRRENVVLLIDDQPTLGRTVGDMLQTEYTSTFTFVTLRRGVGDGGGDLADSHSPGFAMPGDDGLALLQQFRSNPSTRDVPVIVLSGKNEPITKLSISMGADELPRQAFPTAGVVARIRRHSKNYLRTWNKLKHSESSRSRRIKWHLIWHRQQQMCARYCPIPSTRGPLKSMEISSFCATWRDALDIHGWTSVTSPFICSMSAGTA